MINNILELSESVFETTKKHWSYLHSNPELSFQEINTANYIKSELDKLAIPYQVVNNTSIIGVIENNDPKHLNTIALRADIDALPIIEDTSNDNCSTNGYMHACGHDIHTSALLSTAKLLKDIIKDYSATIVLIFQQGEEVLPGGASIILKSCILDKYNPKMVIGQHAEFSMNVGEYGVCEGMYMASCDEIFVEVKGIGGHAANPHLTKNPIYPASELILAIKDIESKSPEGVPCILSLGKFIANGATNIVPLNVEVEGTFRTMNEEWRANVKLMIKKIASEIAQKYSVEINVNIVDGYSMLYNDIDVASRSKLSLSKVGIVNNLGLRMTSEDFGAYSIKYPTLFYRCGIKDVSWDKLYPAHSPSFKSDEKSLIYAVAGLLQITVDNLDCIH